MTGIEFLLQIGLLGGALLGVLTSIVLGLRFSPLAWWLAGGILGLSILGTVAWSVTTADRLASHTQVVESVPRREMESFVSSKACEPCHPYHYRTWHDSYHRTMTQTASTESVIGDFDGTLLTAGGRTYRLETHGDEFWVDMVDPDWEHDRIAEGVNPDHVQGAPRTRKRIVMTTGSHWMQTYWVASSRDRRLFNFPFVWLRGEERWAPRHDVFLRPPFPQYARQFSTWHNNCIECHAVAGEEEYDPATETYHPRVAELGIACEACHGPADEHVRANQDPQRRYRLHLGGEPDTTIVNPARLPALAATQVCGQCHGMNIFKMDAKRQGVRYRAGGDLTETRMVLRTSDANMSAKERADWPRLKRHIDRQKPTFLAERFWSDGMTRVSGREQNAVTESACFRGGELSCLSCHSLHDSDPDGQVADGMRTDEACFQCHDDYRDQVEEHTHHPRASTGSRCYNCHMSRTTYGLLKAIRSHQIDIPSVRATLETGRPHACNLCHLDRSLGWTDRQVREWYPSDDPPLVLSHEEEEISAAVLWTLTGDAGQRALVAWHLGWEETYDASGQEWRVPYLGHLLTDPYSAVRLIAYRSLLRLPGFEAMTYDFVGPPEERSRVRDRVIRSWLSRGERPDRTGPAVLIDEDGRLDLKTLTELSRQRNDRVVDLRE